MISADDWVVPRLHGDTPFWGKPPLQFWATIVSYKIFGPSEFSARLPSFFFAAFALALVFSMTCRLWGRGVGLQAALILTTSGLFYLYAGACLTDPSLLACVTVALAAFVQTFLVSSKTQARKWGYLFFVGLGLSPLSKGLVGPIFILVPVFVWTIRHKKQREVFSRLPWKSGILLTLTLSVPWHILCEMRSPGFLWYYFVGEHLGRFLISDWTGDLYGDPHEQPLGTIWLFFLTAALPWSLVWIGITWSRRKDKIRLSAPLADPWKSFLFIWLMTPLVFFTFSRNIMISYALPCLPPFAALLANALQSTRAEYNDRKIPWLLIPRLSFVTPILLSAVFL